MFHVIWVCIISNDQLVFRWLGCLFVDIWQGWGIVSLCTHRILHHVKIQKRLWALLTLTQLSFHFPTCVFVSCFGCAFLISGAFDRLIPTSSSGLQPSGLVETSLTQCDESMTWSTWAMHFFLASCSPYLSSMNSKFRVSTKIALKTHVSVNEVCVYFVPRGLQWIQGRHPIPESFLISDWRSPNIEVFQNNLHLTQVVQQTGTRIL